MRSKCIALRRNVNEYDITQFTLSEISYADRGYIAINQNPFMVFGVLQIIWKVHS